MESENRTIRFTLQTLEAQYLALEIILLEYFQRKEIPYINEVKVWLTFITRFPVEERTMMLHLLVSILIDEPARIADDNFLGNLEQQLLDDDIPKGLVIQFMKMCDTYKFERGENNGTA